MLSATTVHAASGETVILLHGLGRTPWSLWRVQQALRRDGYRVVNVAYPSRKHAIGDLSRDSLAPVIAAQSSAPRLHFVTHSLGGIILRCYLRDHPVPNLGRVVMLAPPNAGSELADRLKPVWLYRAINGPAGQQLGTDGLPRALGSWRAGAGQLGIIAGDRSLNPVYSSWLPGPNDGKVTVARARLDGMTDFITVHSSHTWLAWRGRVIAQIQTFLRTGRFTPASSPERAPRV
ncbi:MAG TPA: alpha/beta fold hydrolase [Lacunisphaera sp.]|nr:alpha/beta fold hydrolase [Lacunisphaera sp.]